jgi:hypothetical protein
MVPIPETSLKLDFYGYIIRSKKIKGEIFLQVFPTTKKGQEYNIDYKIVTFPQKEKGEKTHIAIRHIINVRNLDKRKEDVNYDNRRNY